MICKVGYVCFALSYCVRAVLCVYFRFICVILYVYRVSVFNKLGDIAFCALCYWRIRLCLLCMHV